MTAVKEFLWLHRCGSDERALMSAQENVADSVISIGVHFVAPLGGGCTPSKPRYGLKSSDHPSVRCCGAVQVGLWRSHCRLAWQGRPFVFCAEQQFAGDFDCCTHVKIRNGGSTWAYHHRL